MAIKDVVNSAKPIVPSTVEKPVVQVKAVATPQVVNQTTVRNPGISDVNEKPPVAEIAPAVVPKPEVKVEKIEDDTAFHNHPRFKELINEKNEMKKKLAELEAKAEKAPTKAAEQKAISAREKLVEKYISKYGHTKDSAEEIVSDIDSIVAEKVAPLYQQELSNKVDSVIKEFKKGKEDYDTLEPVMLEIFNSFSDEEKSVLANNEGVLDLLYSTAKARVGTVTTPKEETPAPVVVPKTGSVSGKSSGASSGSGWTREKIRNLTTAEYAANQESIEEAYRHGEITQ